MALTTAEQLVTDKAALVTHGIFGFLPATSKAEEITAEYITQLAALEGTPALSINDFIQALCDVANASAALNGNAEAVKITGDLTKTVTDASTGKILPTVADLIKDFVDIKAAVKAEKSAESTPPAQA